MIPVSCDPAPSSLFGIGDNTVTCSATDSANNTSTENFYITVQLQFATIQDSFDSLDDWELVNTYNTDPDYLWAGHTFNNYNASITNSTGAPASSALISGDGFVSWSHLTRTVPLDNLNDDDDLFLGIDYRAVSNWHSSSVTNAVLGINDMQGNRLYFEWLNRGGTLDTGWQSYSKNIIGIVNGHDAITVQLSLVDSWIFNWKQHAYFDNFYLGTTEPLTSAHQSSALNLALPPEDPLVYGNVTKAYSNSLVVDWDDLGDVDYKIVIAPSDSPQDKQGNIVSGDTTFQFINLTPDTLYDVRIGLRGDLSNQTTLQARTLPQTGQSYDILPITLTAVIDNNNVSLSWTDNNDIANDRYRVDRAINDGDFEPTQLRPRTGTAIDDPILPEWSGGDTIRYMVYEKLGDQRIYSGIASVVIP